MSSGILYVSYSGMLEPLGQSQVFAYQEQVARTRVVHLVSFERERDWRDRARRDVVARRMREAGIRWHPLRYHKRPAVAATAWDVARGVALCCWLARRHALGIVHARSYVPGLIALASKRLTGARFVFDMRGFWVDERVDGGLWNRDGRLYAIGKRLERRLLLGADHVVTLTRAAVTEMRGWPDLATALPPISVVPTCTDLDRFRPQPRLRDEGFVLGYAGSAGTWYLFDHVLRSFSLLLELRSDARLLVLNRGEHEFILARAAIAGIPRPSLELHDVQHDAVADQMARMHAAVFFIRPAYSKIASAPTRLGELLGCGIPCLSNHGVGDMTEVLERDRVGVALRDFGDEAIRDALSRLLALAEEPGITERCADSAQRHFSLDDGVRSYQSIYERLDAGS